MKAANNERGTILVFVTLMIVLLLIMVGMGLDTGHLVYIRSQAQPAVDAAALAAASAVPTGNPAEVNNRVAAFNTSNSYLNSTKKSNWERQYYLRQLRFRLQQFHGSR
jgi:Flp pilus assembly protein TadG